MKPENVLLNEGGRPLLSDFGIAREVAAPGDGAAAAVRTLAGSGLPVGTPEYMAPEQLRGEVADRRADVYGLGVVLYELLTGRVPHAGATPLEVMARVLTEATPPPSDYNPGIWPELADVVLGAVAPDPDRRYPDMSSLAEALRRAVLARGPGPNTGPMAALPAGAPASTHPALVSAGLPRQVDWSPAGGATDGVGRDPWGPAGFSDTPLWGVATQPRERRRARLVAAVAVVLVLALGAGGAGGVLLAHHAGVPATTGTASAPGLATGTSTAGHGATPGATAESTPTVARAGGGNPTVVAAPTATPVAAPTATPLLTPTMVVGSSPLNFQPYPSVSPKNCVATQKLTNISAVDAQWSWTNAPAPGGWQYNTAGLTSTSWSDFQASLTMTTPGNSSIYVYIRTGLDTNCTSHSTAATISVAGGNGTQFTVSY